MKFPIKIAISFPQRSGKVQVQEAFERVPRRFPTHGPGLCANCPRLRSHDLQWPLRMEVLNGFNHEKWSINQFNHEQWMIIHNGHDSGTDLLEVPTIYKAYIRPM